MLPLLLLIANTDLGFLSASQAGTLHSTATGRAHSLLHNSYTPARYQRFLCHSPEDGLVSIRV